MLNYYDKNKSMHRVTLEYIFSNFSNDFISLQA